MEREQVFWSGLTNRARTCAIDEPSKSKRRGALLSRFWESTAELTGPRLESFSGELPDLLIEQLDQLDPDERAILETKYFEEGSMKEIAASLNISEKAVESRLSRARKKLKDAILRKLTHAASEQI
jgi:RNA polymerase sigma factor (sigma-70 family)